MSRAWHRIASIGLAIIIAMLAIVLPVTSAFATPTVVTNAADITYPIDLTATLNGNITVTGNGDSVSRGFVWDVVDRGDPGNVAPAGTTYANSWTEAGSFGTGEFSHLIDGLAELTVYYFRAAADGGSLDWDYGDVMGFFIGEEGKVYLEFRPDLDETKIRGQGNVPADAVVNNFVGYTLPIYNDDFQMLEFTLCIPDRWDGESFLLLHVDYCISDADQADTVVVWELIYDYATPNVDVIPALPGYMSGTERYITSDTQYQFYQDWIVINYLARPADPMQADDVLTFKLRREAIGGEQQTDTGDVVVFAVDVLFARDDLTDCEDFYNCILGWIEDGTLIGGESVALYMFAYWFVCIGLLALFIWSRWGLIGYLAGLSWFLMGIFFLGYASEGEASFTSLPGVLAFVHMFVGVFICFFPSIYKPKIEDEGHDITLDDIDRQEKENDDMWRQVQAPRLGRRAMSKRRRNKEG